MEFHDQLPSRNYFLPNSQCGTGLMYAFEHHQNASASGRNITAFARDLDAGGATLPSLCAENPACLWFTRDYEPKGWMDGISPTGNAWGWVCDPDAPQRPSQVGLQLDDGTVIGTYTTNQTSEQAVADERRGGTLHRFSVQVPAWTRDRVIEAYALDFAYGEVLIPWFCPDGQYMCYW